MAIKSSQHFDAIIVGSGPAGATAAHELSKKGLCVAVLEWGDDAPLKGHFIQMAKIAAIPGKGAFINSDLSLVLRGITTGGTSTINFATAMAPPADYFKKYGIDLSDEVKEVAQQLPIQTLPDDLMGPMAHSIMDAAHKLNLNWQKLDKFIHTDLCQTQCPRCTYGCPVGAKWSARAPLNSAIKLGATLITHAKVNQVIIKNGCAVGVEYSHNGKTKSMYGDNIILSAGGIGSPRILQKSGFDNVGKDYFTDPVIAVMGSLKNMKGGREVPMAAGIHLKEDGIMLSDLTLPKPLFQAFAAQVGRLDRVLSHATTLTIMVKIRDELGGNIGPNWLNKKLTKADKQKLEKGCLLAEEILNKAGATSIFRSHHFAAHPGGSAKIGETVDKNLQTHINGLYVCDASVIPEAWGLAPSYTLICLAMRLAKHISRNSDNCLDKPLTNEING